MIYILCDIQATKIKIINWHLRPLTHINHSCITSFTQGNRVILSHNPSAKKELGMKIQNELPNCGGPANF
jgi:hypothetical protein